MKKITQIIMIGILSALLLLTCGCGKEKQNPLQAVEITIPEQIGTELIHGEKMPLVYATGFSVDEYKDEEGHVFPLITVYEDGQFLLITDENMSTVDDKKLKKIKSEAEKLGIVCIESPEHIYLAASQSMDMLATIGAIDKIAFSSQEEKGWYIEEAVEAMQAGTLVYAGKYSTPDYEKIIDGGCDLAIENTMIYHTPEVKEKIESFGIPVLVDRSSYEKEPLGRMEWVKLYGVLTGHRKEAEDAFLSQQESYQEITIVPTDNPPTVAFFYIAANGEVKVRKSADYFPKMIAMAGGKYIFDDLGSEEDNAASTVTITMEEFYAAAKDADYIIYNCITTGELSDMEDLRSKSELLANMKAVQEGKVFCTAENLYQSTMEMGTMILDINKMLCGNDDMEFLYHLEE